MTSTSSSTRLLMPFGRVAAHPPIIVCRKCEHGGAGDNYWKSGQIRIRCRCCGKDFDSALNMTLERLKFITLEEAEHAGRM
jgi:hypothetical protein